MRVTTKGQVTIPKNIREKLGVAPGGNVGFEEEDGKVVLVNAENSENVNAGLKLVRHLQEMGRKTKRIPMTTEELMELTRGPFNDLDAD